MRLVKINDIILNMDNIAVIKGSKIGGGVGVYAYSAGKEICLGRCDNEEDYQQLVDMVYKEFSDHFLGEVIITNDDEEELWK